MFFKNNYIYHQGEKLNHLNLFQLVHNGWEIMVVQLLIWLETFGLVGQVQRKKEI